MTDDQWLTSAGLRATPVQLVGEAIAFCAREGLVDVEEAIAELAKSGVLDGFSVEEYVGFLDDYYRGSVRDG